MLDMDERMMKEEDINDILTELPLPVGELVLCEIMWICIVDTSIIRILVHDPHNTPNYMYKYTNNQQAAEIRILF